MSHSHSQSERDAESVAEYIEQEYGHVPESESLTEALRGSQQGPTDVLVDDLHRQVELSDDLYDWLFQYALEQRQNAVGDGDTLRSRLY